MRPYALALVLVIVSAVCFAVEGQELPGNSEQGTDARNRVVVQPTDFVGDVPTITGAGWEVAKFKHEERLWKARLQVDGKTVREFGDCGQFEDWMRFYVWPPEGSEKRLLMVFRFAGGAHGPRNIDIVDLKDEFRTILASRDHFNFDEGLEDLDGDGFPEVIGRSVQFDYFDFALHFSHAGSPFPVIIMTYNPESRRYRCENHRFPDRTREPVADAEERFRRAWPTEDEIPADIVVDGSSLQEARGAFVHLVHWAVHVCYAGNEAAAFALLDRYADPVLATFTKHAIRRNLWKDPNYQEMKRLQREAALLHAQEESSSP